MMRTIFAIVFIIISQSVFSQVEDKVYLETEVDSVAQFPGGKNAFKKMGMREVNYRQWLEERKLWGL